MGGFLYTSSERERTAPMGLAGLVWLSCWLASEPVMGYGHAHSFVAGHAPADGSAVIVASTYVRAGDFLSVSCSSAVDIDHCVALYCPLSRCGPHNLPSIYDTQTTVLGWTDNGAGGSFWRATVGGYVLDNSGATTHYQAPEAAGVVHLQALRDDDVLLVYDWTSNPPQFVPTADDAPSWTPARDITVWEFTITDAPGWEPLFDAPTQFTATIAPATDHLGQSLAGIITFHLSSSSENGYCLNMTRVHTPPEEWEWNDTHQNAGDVKFTPDQEGLTIDYMGEGEEQATATTTSAQLVQSVEVTCLDWGARASLAATAEWPSGPLTGLPSARVETDGEVDPTRTAVPLPVDEEPEGGNGIADVGAGEPFNPYEASDDGETAPVGRRRDDDTVVRGDGWSAYDEYRGFIIGGTHVRLWPDSYREVLVYNPDGLSLAHLTLGYAVCTGFGSDEVAIVGEAALVRRYADDQSWPGDCNYAWHVYVGDADPGNPYATGSTLPQSIIAGATTIVDRDAIHALYPEVKWASKEARTIGHEFGHAVRIVQANSDHVDYLVDHPCIMTWVALPDIGDTDFCTEGYIAEGEEWPDRPCIYNHSIMPW